MSFLKTGLWDAEMLRKQRIFVNTKVVLVWIDYSRLLSSFRSVDHIGFQLLKLPLLMSSGKFSQGFGAFWTWWLCRLPSAVALCTPCYCLCVVGGFIGFVWHFFDVWATHWCCSRRNLGRANAVRNSFHKWEWEVLETEMWVLFECCRERKSLSFEIYRMVLPSPYFGHVAVFCFPVASDLSLSQPPSTSVMWLFLARVSCTNVLAVLLGYSYQPLPCHLWVGQLGGVTNRPGSSTLFFSSLCSCISIKCTSALQWICLLLWSIHTCFFSFCPSLTRRFVLLYF